MFEFSSKTQVNRKFKTTELYKVTSADKSIKADMINIGSVTLTNVLNNDTLNLSVKGAVKEIYVFEIALTTKTAPALFISALDKATNFHTIFILKYGNEEVLYGAFKEYGEKGMKVGKYYCTDWAAEKPIALPLGVNSLDEIYTAIVDELIKEIEKLQHLVDTEKQPKRRFELNDELKKLKDNLKELQGD